MPNRRQKITFFITIGLVALAISMIPTLADTASAAYKYGDVSTVTKVLSRNYTGADWVYNLYSVSRGLVNIIALVVLLIIAFSNILHINIETYTMKKLLLPLIIALVIANLALPIFAIFSRVVDEFQRLALFKPDYVNYDYVLGSLNPFRKIDPGVTLPHIGITMILLSAIVVSFASGFGIIIGLVFFVIMFGLLAVLNMILAFRPYIIYTMAAISPVAIILSVLPMTQPYFKRWLGIIVPWMVMPLACFFLINIGTTITSAAGSMMIPGSGVVGSIIGYFLPALIKLGLLLLAIRFPFMIEKDIGGVINKIGKFIAKEGPAAGGRLSNLAYDRLYKGPGLAAGDKALGLLQQHARGEDIGEDGKQKLMDIRMTDLKSTDKYKAMGSEEKKEAEEKEREKVEEELDLLGTEKDVDKQGEYIEDLMNDSYRNAGAIHYQQSSMGRLGLTIASIANAPLGITIALKDRRETEDIKAGRTSQKALLRFTEVVPDKYGGKFVQKYFSGSALMGEYGGDKYATGVVEADLNRQRDPDLIKRYVQWDSLIGKVTDQELRKEGKTLRQMLAIMQSDTASKEEKDRATRIVADAGTRVYGQAKYLNDNAESGTQYARTLGLGNFDNAKFVVAYEKLAQEYYRIATRSGMKTGVALERVKEGQRMLGNDIRNSATGGEGASGITGISQQATADPQTLEYLRRIATQGKTGDATGNIGRSVERALASGIKPEATAQIEAQQADTLSRIERALLTAGSKPDQAGRIVKALRSSSAVDVGTTIESISRSESVNPEIAKLLGEFQGQVTAKTATIATRDQAQSVQRYATALAPVVTQRPEQLRVINTACEVIIKAEMGAGNYTPEQVSQAKQTVATALPGTISTTKEGGYEVGAETAATVSRALEVITPGD